VKGSAGVEKEPRMNEMLKEIVSVSAQKRGVGEEETQKTGRREIKEKKE